MKFKKGMIALAIAASSSTTVFAQNISGQVVDALGLPIVNAEVHIDKEKTHVKTDSQGRFVINNVNKGIAELHVSADKFNHYNQKITITEQDLSGLTVTLTSSVMEIIDVHATPLHSSTIESAQPVNVLSADDLRMKQASTLGETLKNEVGVHSTYYGPVSSSPIIRGLDGPRVLISQNGLDVGDASRVGGDHVVSSETTTATQIEVLRGPATLFYGSGAIGGVVNVVDNRVPTYSDTTFDYQAQHNSVSDENEGSFALNTGSGQFALHLDGFWRESNDTRIPGYASLETEEEHEEDDHDHEEHEGEKGKIANSAAKSSGYTLGTSYLLDNGYIGFSYGRLDREYGVPGHGAHDEEHEHEDEALAGEEEDEHQVYARLKQNRYQMISDLNFEDQFLSRLATKFAYTDYQHQEIEDGAVGTTFKNDSLEARVDLYHQEWNGWNGAWTLHYKHSDFEALGEEAFTPPSETASIALGWLEEKHFGDWLLQTGVRVEHVELTPNMVDLHDHELAEDHEDAELTKQSFTPVSASLGLVWDYAKGYNLGISASFSQRAPSSAELFSNGPHIGTNTFELGALYELHQEGDELHIEIGDQDVALETSYNLDLTWRKFEGDFGFIVSAFYNHVNDFYYQQDTGYLSDAVHDHEEEAALDEEHGHGEGLPIFVYRQDDVNLYGVEAEFVYQISSPLKATVFSDYTRAKLADGGNLPRIPPLRFGAQLNYQANDYSAELSYSRYFDQDNTAAYETNTDGYNMLDANFNYYLPTAGADTTLFIKANNITNEEARVHSSFLKNDAPLPGRNISVGIRGSF
ncbi:TonB-dependent receptor [Colwellia sp. MEBiC06753]